jgi:uncharacterized DUF497 family protein
VGSGEGCIEPAQARHSFAEAVTVLLDPLALTDEDSTHLTEIRWFTVGSSFRARTLVVVHTDDDDTVRIISARKATARERRTYEKGHEE